MKVQCPSCREIVEMVDFYTSQEGLGFTCGNCKKPNFLTNPQAQAGEEEKETAPAARTDEVICPKCGHGQRDRHACHRCGLVFEKFDKSLLPPDPPEAASLWKEIQQLPPDDALHEAFLAACFKADRLDYAARQYRLLSREPGKKAVAEKMLSRLLEKAQARLAPAAAVTAGRRGESKRKSKIAVWIVLAVCMGLLVYFLMAMTDMLNRMSP